MYIFSSHQQKQKEVIDSLEQQIRNKSVGFSTVAPVNDYENDSRICLTSVHFPHDQLISEIQDNIIRPLQKLSPENFFYPPDSMHMTIKNIRVVNDPPHFTDEDIVKAEKVYDSVIPNHQKFNVYFYRLLLFPNNLALIGTTDAELDKIILNLDEELKNAGVPDDKKYINSQYFFSNMTLARSNNIPSEEFINKVEELSKSISFQPYTVDSATLITCTAVFTKKNIIKTWNLKE
jgi:2'-5' RNA ligase